MKEVLTISNIRFIPVKKTSSLIGFVSFTLNDSFAMKDVAVHIRLDRTGYRLDYPKNKEALRQNKEYFHPINQEATKLIDNEITCWLKANDIN